MQIAVLGTGSVGTTLGKAFAAAGHTVNYGSRTPDEAAGKLSLSDAVQGADVILTAVPGTATQEILENAGEENLNGKVILDVSNAFTPQFTLAFPNDSVARRIQERFPKAKVVKSLSTMNVSVMVNPAGVSPKSNVFVSGNDDDAKNVVRSLLADLGWTADSIIDLGDVNSAAGAESYGLLFMNLMQALQTPSFNITISR